MNYEAFEDQTDEELRNTLYAKAEHVDPGISFLRDELWQREARRREERMEEMTKQATEATHQVRILTWAIFVLTLVTALSAIVGAIAN